MSAPDTLVDFHTGDDPNEHIYLHKIPLGVSVGICPWNFPVFVMARKLAPALVTGNTVVVKSSEVTPLTCARIAELWTASDDAAMPPKGTYSIITGLGSTVGAALVSSPLVDIVSVRAEINISQLPRVDPYAIDATSARWRDGAGPSRAT